MNQKPFDAEYSARVLERIAENEDVQKRIAPKTTGRVNNDALKGLLVMRTAESEERVVEIISSTKFGRFTLAVRELFGLPKVSKRMLDKQHERDLRDNEAVYVREEAESKERLALYIREAFWKKLNLPSLPREFPDKDTLKTQPVIVSPDSDSDSTRIPTDFNEIPREEASKEMGFDIDPKTGATKPMVLPPPPPPKEADTGVNRSIVQGIAIFEVPLPTRAALGYDRCDLEFVGGDACTLVEKGVTAVYYCYGSGSYEGYGSLVAVFDDGSVDAVSLGHCSCNGPLDQLSGLRRGEYKDFAEFQSKLSSEAAEDDYSTIIAFIAYTEVKDNINKRAKKAVKKSKAKKATKKSAKKRRK